MKIKLIIILILAALTPRQTYSQSTTDTVPPLYSAGQRGLFEYLGKTIRYPLKPKSEKVSDIVYASFLVNQKGSIDSVWFAKEVDKWLKKEVFRCIKGMAVWRPAKVNGSYVATQINLPVGFYLENDPVSKLNVKHFDNQATSAKYSITLDELFIIELFYPVNTETSEFINLLGVEALNNKEFNEAIKYFNEVFNKAPNTPDLLFNRALAKYNSGDLEGACKDWYKASENGDVEAKNIYQKYCND